MAFDQFLYKGLGTVLGILSVSAAILLMPAVFAAQASDDKPLLIERCWDYPTGELGIVSIAVDNEHVFTAFDDGSVKAIGLKDGRISWSADLGGKVSSNLIDLTDRVLVVTSSVESNGAVQNSTFRALSKETGLTLFSTPIPAAARTYLLLGTETIIAIGSTGSAIGLTTDGKPRWNFAMSSELAGEPQLRDGGISIPLADRSVQLIGSTNGETISKHNGESLPKAVAADADGLLFIGDDRGRVYSTDIRSGAVKWTFKTGGRIEHLVSNSDRIYAASVDNFVYSISKDKGSVVWKKRLASRIDGRPLLWASMLVISSFGESSVTVVDVKDGKTLKTIEFGPENIKVATSVLSNEGSLILPLQNGIRVVRFEGCLK